MQHLILRPGPVLVTRPFTPGPGETGARTGDDDVTTRAHEYLFAPVTLSPDTTLGDVFSLLDENPLLHQVFRQDFALELCDEARKGPLPATPAAPHEAIEYLELYQQWGLDSSRDEYSGTDHLHLHGIGVELSADVPDLGNKQGERIQWSVSLTPLRELLHLPIRVNPEVLLTEDDEDAKAFMLEIRRVRHPEVTLGQVIRGLLWELSFHGSPEEQREIAEELKRRSDEIDAGTAELVSGDDLFESLDSPGCETLFETLAGRSPREIAAAIRRIEDGENAAAWLGREFNGEVIVKARFRERTGREFRKAFRAAAR